MIPEMAEHWKPELGAHYHLNLHSGIERRLL